MSRRIALFLIALMLFLFVYISSSYKFVVYNHSGRPIEKLLVQSSWWKRKLTNVKDNEVLHFSIFAPFKKQVRIIVKDSTRIHSMRFKLQRPFSGEKYNQVEIGEDGMNLLN